MFNCSNPVSGDHIYLDQSSTWNTSSVNPSVKSISSRYSKAPSSSVSAGSSGKSKGLAPSNGLIIGTFCTRPAADTDEDAGAREYIGSNISSHNAGSGLRVSGPERERLWLDPTRLGPAETESPAIDEDVGPQDSFPEPSEPDHSPTLPRTLVRREEECEPRTGVWDGDTEAAEVDPEREARADEEAPDVSLALLLLPEGRGAMGRKPLEPWWRGYSLAWVAF